MRSRVQVNFITIILAALVASGGAWVCARYVISHRDNGGSTLHDMVHADLNLSAEQDQKLDLIEQKYAEQRKAKEADIRAANRELATAIQAGHQDSPEVEAAIDHIHMAMGALQKLTVMHVFDMRAVLTPEQAKKFDAKVAAALNDASR